MTADCELIEDRVADAPEFGAILPEDAFGAAAVTSGALTAPFGAGAELPPDVGAALLMPIAPDPELDGAIFPGEAPGGVTVGDATAPFGAGELVGAL